MKRARCILFAIAVAGCGRKHGGGDDRSPYPLLWVNGIYSMNVVETENTCACDGPRQFPDPVPVKLEQDDDGTDAAGNHIPTDTVYFDGGGIRFGGPGTLTTANVFAVTDYAVSDIMTANYSGTFKSHNGVATHHMGTLRIDYAQGACCNAMAGYNVLDLNGDNTSSSAGSAAMAPSACRFDARPRR